MTTDTSTSAEDATRARADLITSIVLIVLGVAVFYFSWTMDRLEVRRISPATIPGLVPMILGVALTLCGSLLAWRSWRIQIPGSGAALLSQLVSWPAIRVLAVLGLALVFTLVLMGRMPFWLAAGIFIFTFIVLFETVLADTPKPLVATLLWAVGIAAVGAGGIWYIFERIFLVRLP
jgi:hypothetical protein